jgi:hypothetical protein
MRVRRRVVVFDAHERRPYRSVEWRGAIVHVRRGELELVGASGRRYRFGAGSILWLCDLPLIALGNLSDTALELVVVSTA